MAQGKHDEIVARVIQKAKNEFGEGSRWKNASDGSIVTIEDIELFWMDPVRERGATALYTGCIYLRDQFSSDWTEVYEVVRVAESEVTVTA